MQKCIICLEEGVYRTHECCTHKCTNECANKKKHFNIDTNNYTNSIMHVVSIAIISIVDRFRLIAHRNPNYKCE
jgi:hypothetical protein